jgi:methionyl-tRNA formyltransferase
LQIDAATVGASGANEALPGTVISVDPLTVACGAGTLEIKRLRPEGRRAMSPVEFRAGNTLEKGDLFGIAPVD